VLLQRLQRQPDRARRTTARTRENGHDERPPRVAAANERCSRGVPRAKASWKEPALPCLASASQVRLRKESKGQANRTAAAAAWMAMAMNPCTSVVGFYTRQHAGARHSGQPNYRR
jgi:hypothetical protein